MDQKFRRKQKFRTPIDRTPSTDPCLFDRYVRRPSGEPICSFGMCCLLRLSADDDGCPYLRRVCSQLMMMVGVLIFHPYLSSGCPYLSMVGVLIFLVGVLIFRSFYGGCPYLSLSFILIFHHLSITILSSFLIQLLRKTLTVWPKIFDHYSCRGCWVVNALASLIRRRSIKSGIGFSVGFCAGL